MAGPFSEGGAAQLHHDITKGLVPLLSNYCDDIARMQLLERYYRNPYNFYCNYEAGVQLVRCMYVLWFDRLGQVSLASFPGSHSQKGKGMESGNRAEVSPPLQ